MPYTIETKDGIVVNNIPDNIPRDAPELRARVSAAREQRNQADTNRAAAEESAALKEQGAKGFRRIGAVSEGLQSGATFGFSDEIQAGIGAAAAKLLGGESTEDATLKELYRMGLESARGRQGELREEFPVASFAGEVAGGLATGGAAFKAASAPVRAAGAGKAATFLGASALTGGAAGVGYGEQMMPTDWAKDFAIGATEGAVIGKAIQSAPWLAKKFRDFSLVAPAKARNYMASLAGINPEAVKDFVDAGVPATVSSATTSPSVRSLDRWLQKFPVSAGKIASSAQRTFAAIEDGIDKAVPGRAASAFETGQMLTKATERYADKFKETSKKLYDRISRHVPGSERVGANNTLSAVREIMSSYKETPQLQQIINSMPASRLGGGLASDAAGKPVRAFEALRQAGFEFPVGMKEAIDAVEATSGGSIPYKALKQYRSQIGSLIKENVIAGKDNALSKRLYGALSEDMKAAFAAKGDDALRDFNRVNKFFHDGVREIEDTLFKLRQDGVPEKMYAHLSTSSKFGGSRMRGMLKTLTDGEKQTLRKTFVSDMGDRNGKFSPTKFFNELDKRYRFAPEALDALFSGDAKKYLADLRKVGKVFRRVEELEKLTNFSNTGMLANMTAILAGLRFAPVSTTAAAGTAYVTSSLLTSPKFVHTLAKYANAKPSPNRISRFMDDMAALAAQDPENARDIQRLIAVLGIQAAARGGQEE